MIEELKQILTVIGTMPEMALHAFFAFGAYKLFVYLSTTAGIYGAVRYLISSVKEVQLKHPPVSIIAPLESNTRIKLTGPEACPPLDTLSFLGLSELKSNPTP